MPIDFKKIEKDLYQPRTTPSIIKVPEMKYIAVDVKGDPNKSLVSGKLSQQSASAYSMIGEMDRMKAALNSSSSTRITLTKIS
ncbi:hypothetical protein [Sporolactobacillus vineae]|uniref:hypothetical protein n=1 Tax=Sporolactobacillus vineae TaxID=444463 RepID=UPI000287C0DF